MLSDRHSGKIANSRPHMSIGTSEIRRPTAIAILIWLFIQLFALGICAARAPLWAGAPKATEHSALVLMLAVQIGISALIFPHLLGTTGAAILAIASGWPMAQLSAQMADASFGALMRGEFYVSVWLISLHFWTRALRSQNSKLLGSALAAMISFGGPVLWYLRTEFSDDFIQRDSDSFPAFGPMSGAIFQTFARFNSASWILLGIMTCIGAMAFMGTRRISRFQ